MIEIQGLTDRQSKLADMIWAQPTQDHVRAFIDSLPGEYKQEAVAVYHLIVAAYIDNIEDVEDAVKQLIASIASR